MGTETDYGEHGRHEPDEDHGPYIEYDLEHFGHPDYAGPGPVAVGETLYYLIKQNDDARLAVSVKQPEGWWIDDIEYEVKEEDIDGIPFTFYGFEFIFWTTEGGKIVSFTHHLCNPEIDPEHEDLSDKYSIKEITKAEYETIQAFDAIETEDVEFDESKL